jgi:hypothetical protein
MEQSEFTSRASSLLDGLREQLGLHAPRAFVRTPMATSNPSQANNQNTFGDMLNLSIIFSPSRNNLASPYIAL